MTVKRIFVVKSDGRLRAIDIVNNERENSRLLQETFSGTRPEEVQLEKDGKISYFMMYSPLLSYDSQYHKNNKASQLRGKDVRGPVMIYKKKRSKYHEHWQPGLSFDQMLHLTSSDFEQLLRNHNIAHTKGPIGINPQVSRQRLPLDDTSYREKFGSTDDRLVDGAILYLDAQDGIETVTDYDDDPIPYQIYDNQTNPTLDVGSVAIYIPEGSKTKIKEENIRAIINHEGEPIDFELVQKVAPAQSRAGKSHSRARAAHSQMIESTRAGPQSQRKSENLEDILKSINPSSIVPENDSEFNETLERLLDRMVHSQLITAQELEELGDNREAIFKLGLEKLLKAIEYVKDREVDWQQAGIILEEILEKMVRNVEKSAELILYAEDGSVEPEELPQIEQGAEEEFENAGALGAGLLIGGLGGLALGSYLGGYRWGRPYGYYGYPVYGPRIHRHYYASAKASSNVESSDAGAFYGGFGYPALGYGGLGYGGYYGINPWLSTYYTPGVARRINRRNNRRHRARRYLY